MYAKIRPAVMLLGGLIVAGTLGFMLLEDWTILDSLYMTVITLSTVGFGEVHRLSPGGKLFTSILILVGVGTLAYIATRVTEALLDQARLRERRMRREIKRMHDHVIVCGFGRMGATLARILEQQGTQPVVVEKDPAMGERLERDGLPHVIGDATDESSLIEAGIHEARALAAVLPHDADNLFVTITSRGLNPKLNVIARSGFEKNDAKMIAAGATHVLNPYRHGGRLMAQQLLQPNVTEFIDFVSRWGEANLGLEEIRLQAGSRLAGVMLRDSPIRKELDAIVVGVRRPSSGLIFNPPHDLAPQPEDILIVLGRRSNLQRLARLAAGGE